ncbi:hypothetical protein IW261DRAFT_896995 [Armillaria novae-zelandiae]|uniref:Hydrophobin n=1 Tax=Armillaria novae-zelandiae TaxID=153914 RepID=A0AA39NT34_9AGAR|nr:hypothetical protein IW261DRAFT_896995 [Armillaria novae-zelandiae]
MNLLTSFLVLVVLPLQIIGQSSSSSSSESITVSLPPEVTSFLSSASISLPSSGVIPNFPSSLVSSISSIASAASSAGICVSTSGCTNAAFHYGVSGGMVIAGAGVGLLAMAV